MDGGKTKSNAIEVPSISLPKGRGAIKGIDEKFSVNAVNGTAPFSVPLHFFHDRGALPSLTSDTGSIKWVLTEQGELIIAPHSIPGVEISQAVIAENQAIISAGEANIAGGSIEINISNSVGHFIPPNST